MAKADKAAKKEAKAAKKAEKKANGGGLDQETKNTIIKCVATLACFGIVSASVSSGLGKIADAKLAGVNSDASASESAGDDTAFEDDAFAGFDDAGTIDDGTADAGTEDAGAADAAGDVDTAAPADSSTAGDSASAATTGGTSSTASAGQSTKIPSTKAEILKVYNDATAKAAKAAVPFQKDRITTEKKYEAGVALKAFKSIVYQFMGVGDANKFSKTVTAADKDSYHKYFQASKLTEADITNATCKQSGDNYLIAINIKDGTSSVKGGQVVNSNNAPLDRSGLACGADDKDYWDHKPAQNIIAAIDDVPGAAKGDISERYSNAVINVVINAKTGNIVSLNAKFDFHMDLANVMGSSGVAEATSTVTMKDFKW